MDSNLKSTLKRHFKNYSMLLVDLDGLYTKYSTFHASVYTSPNGVYLNLSGTVPYMFSGFVFKAPVLIKVPTDYPFSSPLMFVVPTDTIKIVKNHPNVDLRGNVTLTYLEQWTHTSKLVLAVDSLQSSFNRISPIYSTFQSPKTNLSDQNSSLITEQSFPEGLFSKYRLSDRDRSMVEHAYKNIMTNLKNNRQDLVREYQYDLNKYEIHRNVLTNWVYALLNLNNVRLKLDEIESKIENELKSQKVEKIRELYDEVGQFVRDLTASKATSSSLEDEDFQVEDILKFKDSDSERLADLISTEAACSDLLEFLHETYKRNQISTRSYVQEMRKLSHEYFLSKLNREKLLN